MSLTKKEVQSIIANYLEFNPKTQLADIRDSVEKVLKSRGIIGEKSKHSQSTTTTWVERISDEDALLTNEVIYDLLYSRIITPGVDRDNLELPWVHVSDKRKLQSLM